MNLPDSMHPNFDHSIGVEVLTPRKGRCNIVYCVFSDKELECGPWSHCAYSRHHEVLIDIDIEYLS